MITSPREVAVISQAAISNEAFIDFGFNHNKSLFLWVRLTMVMGYGRIGDTSLYEHDDVIKWKHFLRHWLFVRGIHRSPVWLNGWVNNREAVDLRRYLVNYDVTVITSDDLVPCIYMSIQASMKVLTCFKTNQSHYNKIMTSLWYILSWYAK